jgi:hypothetical protein
MKSVWCVLAALSALVATDASAQVLDLSGRYRCIQLCRDGLVGAPAFVTQNGWEMNLVNEVGEPSRAWVDWVGHIWAQRYNQGAVYTPDGIFIQFDSGTVWQRDLGGPVAVAPVERYRAPAPIRRGPVVAPPPEALAPARTAYDGPWGVIIQTQYGSCDPEYRFGVQIANGNVIADAGGMATFQGQVSPDGSVWVSVAGGGQQAAGQGRLSANVGSGTWRGQSMNGPCSGVWQAVRRG